MRAIVEVRTGRLKGKKAPIEPGSTLRIGRTDRATLSFPFDMQMSALHCELAWNGETCRLRDLGSLKGTRLRGEAVLDADVTEGSDIQAGDTVLSVYFENGIPPRRRRRPEPDVAAARARALDALRREPGALHAVLDAARDERVLELLPRSTEEYQSLYEGVQGEALAEVAPYLVELAKDSRLLERLVMEGWGSAWGVYLTWAGPKRDLRRHLRRFLMVVDDETTRRMYFRFYDPRVLRDFLPTCSVLQTEELFGEIGCFLVEGDRADVVRFEREAR